MAAPVLQAAFADNPSQILATFDQAIDADNPDLGTAFQVSVGGEPVDIGTPSYLLGLQQVMIPLVQPIPGASSDVKLVIINPVGITNQAGEQAVAGQIDVVLDTVPSAAVNASLSSDGRTLIINFNDDLDSTSLPDTNKFF